ncbi:amidohydrolase family protein [Pontixanthobacter gangjinensis]|uniref:Amidohydrolase family protein n=1 Tax=Pontixanthobacter gangjinensis TaxID=1028742 RepID=A0A6I4SR16_9SPHN|nr:amidohydrolase family protein [Pontixanthobacter gangjinensis]MXO57848.1 amidohydrolase family protein [Pontixanthobacter gangjinensis]
MSGKIRRSVIFTLAIAAACAASAQEPAAELPIYDIVLKGGRVMDPETGLDAILNVGITDRTITAISAEEIRGVEMIDVTGQIVAPGFIDVHNHSPTPLGQMYQARDGVTTSLELEAGSYPVAAHGAYIRRKARINYGASTSHTQARMVAMSGGNHAPVQNIMGAKRANIGLDNGEARARYVTSNAGERAKIRRTVEDGLQQGGIGIGLLLDYISEAVDEDEVRAIFELASQYQTPVFVHIRRGAAGDPTGLDEVLTLAKATGAKVHICHLSHSAMKNVALFLEKIREARTSGVDVTTEVLPYNAGSTSIGAAVFGRDWQEIFGIGPEDVQLASTGEFFTQESFDQTRKESPNAAIMHHYLKEEWTRLLVAAPDVILSSDGLPVISLKEKAPPQGIGSFSKLVGTYVRDEQLLPMMSALSKITLQPAQLLENAAPAFRLKGRLQTGMDADITVFDPAVIMDMATYLDPHQPSIGVTYLLVNGSFVIKNGDIEPSAFPGRQIFASPLDKR